MTRKSIPGTDKGARAQSDAPQRRMGGRGRQKVQRAENDRSNGSFGTPSLV